MNPLTHFLVGLLISVFIFITLPFVGIIEASIFLLASFLIDFDHYLYFVFVEKKTRLKKAYKWFLIKKEKYFSLPRKERKKHYQSICLFHGIEPLVFIFILGHFVHYYFYFVLAGMFIHLLLDILEDVVIYNSCSLKYSIIYTYLKTRKLKIIQA